MDDGSLRHPFLTFSINRENGSPLTYFSKTHVIFSQKPKEIIKRFCINSVPEPVSVPNFVKRNWKESAEGI